jgi:hypothetical protein
MIAEAGLDSLGILTAALSALGLDEAAFHAASDLVRA